jgi:sterol 3beta-glucosyltransferase
MFDDVPHDWLFPRVSLVVHHAGAGTTAAAIRAGRPSIVIPFAFDQPFWAERLHALGAAHVLRPAELTADRLAAEISTALRDDDLHRAADALRRSSESEDGIANAIAILERCVQAPC